MSSPCQLRTLTPPCSDGFCSADGQPLSKNELKKRAKDAEKAEKAAKRAAREAEEARIKKEKDDQVSHLPCHDSDLTGTAGQEYI